MSLTPPQKLLYTLNALISSRFPFSVVVLQELFCECRYLHYPGCLEESWTVPCVYLSWSLWLWRRARCHMVWDPVKKWVKIHLVCLQPCPSARGDSVALLTIFVLLHFVKTFMKHHVQSSFRKWQAWWDTCAWSGRNILRWTRGSVSFFVINL